MRQHLATLAIALLGGGCSLLYNPNNIIKDRDASTPIDSPVDVEVITDVNPAALELDDLAPSVIFEGQGKGNGRPCVLVVRGHQMLDATIAVAPTTANANVNLTLGTQMVSPDHNVIAVEVTADVMPTVDAGADIPLTVTVTQTGAAPQTLPWALSPLDQFPTTSPIDVATLRPAYSAVTLTTAVTFTGSSRAVIVSMSSITVSAAIDASGSNQTAGPGGCAAGTGSSTGGCAGGGGPGASGGGGGGGFAATGSNGGGTGVGAGGAPTGDPLIGTYDGHPVGGANANAASGGGGGAGGTLGLGNGGAGGAGGGTVELTARGDLTIAGVKVNGGTGAAAPGGIGTAAGGGGAGGVILLRSGATLALGSPALLAQGGPGGTGGAGAGGAGSVGRIRYDAPTSPTIPAGTMPAPHRGPAFVSPPTITTNQRPTLTVAGSTNDGYSYVVHDQGSNQKDTGLGRSFNGSGTDTFIPVLTAGDNEVCVLVAGGVYTDPEAKNCVHIAFLPGL